MVILAVTAAAVVVPAADALRVAPLASRDGVVLTWRAQNKTAVIAQPSGKLLAIHAIRRVTPGSRVTVSGIKWGSPVSGIKWSAAPSGIKWGIKWGRNGSYQSGISTRRGTKKAVWTPVRGPIVKKFGKKAVAVGTPGGIVVVRVATRRSREGLSGQKELMAGGLPPVGATISIRVYFGKNGIKIGRNLRYLKPPVPGASLPIAGAVASINVAAKTMVVVDNQDRAYPVRITVALPPEFTIAPYTRGSEVAVSGRFKPNGVMTSTLISENGSFREADDPTTTQILPSGGACANAIENVCPQTAPVETPDSGSTGQIPGGAPVPPSSSSPPTPPSPPPGGTPPGGDPTPPGGDPAPPGDDPDTDPPADEDPPPGCRPATGRGTWNAPWVRHRPGKCWLDWCKAQRRAIGKWPVGCSPGRPWHRYVNTSRHR